MLSIAKIYSSLPRKKQYIEDEVVAKAMNTFWHNGYESTSVRLLEKNMGINQFSIYSSFGSKHNLFIEVLKKYKEHVKSTLLKSLMNSDGDIEDIRQFFLSFGHSIQSGKLKNGCLMINTGMEVGKTDLLISNQLTKYFDFVEDAFCRVLEKAKAKGNLEKKFNSKKHAGYFLGSLQGLTLYAKYHSKIEVDGFIAMIMKSIEYK